MMQKNLHSPLLDFALLGGGSLIALLAVRMSAAALNLDAAWSLTVTLFLANLINHPHFACSYQIFYGDFKNKLFSPSYELSLRVRYFVIGIVVPVAIASAMFTLVKQSRSEALGLCANLMFLLVGWHYVKQGYGMAMLDATLKRAFYNEAEKRILLRNAYAVWLLAWLTVNFLTKNQTPNYFGIPYVALAVPAWALALSALGALATTVQCIAMLTKLRRQERMLAWNGLVAYAVSLYAWLLIRDPIILLWVPLFHSLQYLAVVWRFQVNRSKSKDSAKLDPRYRMAAFFALSFVLGYYMFWQAPEWLDANVSYDKQVFGGSLFFFLFWTFINIHHYFLDTVMWRKGNPEVKRHLFAAPPA